MRYVQVGIVFSTRFRAVVVNFTLLLLEVLNANWYFYRDSRFQVDRFKGNETNYSYDVLCYQAGVYALRNVFEIYVGRIASLVSSGYRRFVIHRGVRRSNASTSATIAANGDVRISGLVCSRVRFRSICFFSVSNRFLRTFTMFTINYNRQVINIRPLRMFFTRNYSIHIKRNSNFHYITANLCRFTCVSFLSASFRLYKYYHRTRSTWGYHGGGGSFFRFIDFCDWWCDYFRVWCSGIVPGINVGIPLF